MTCEEEEDPCGSCSTCRDESVGPAELMDEYWFFHNMLERSRVFKLKSSADASCSSTFKEMAVRNPDRGLPSTIPKDHVFVTPTLLRAPSLPPSIAREKAVQTAVERQVRPSNSTLQRSFSSIDQTPLPSMRGNPRRSSKATTPKLNMDNRTSVEANCRRVCKIKSMKSLSDLEVEEVQGFMDLGFVFNKDDVNPSILNIIPGLQEKRPVDDDEDDKVRRPYLSEAWLVHRSDPPNLNWVDRKSAVDMKEQLKTWARTVASNVRQE